MLGINVKIKPLKHVSAICPKSLTREVAMGLTYFDESNIPPKHVLYKINERSKGDLFVSMRRKGVLGYIQNLIKLNQNSTVVKPEERTAGLGAKMYYLFGKMYRNLMNS